MDAQTTAACIAGVIIIGLLHLALVALDRALARYNRLEYYDRDRK
jgi:hypothetical protein